MEVRIRIFGHSLDGPISAKQGNRLHTILPSEIVLLVKKGYMRLHRHCHNGHQEDKETPVHLNDHWTLDSRCTIHAELITEALNKLPDVPE